MCQSKGLFNWTCMLYFEQYIFISTWKRSEYDIALQFHKSEGVFWMQSIWCSIDFYSHAFFALLCALQFQMFFRLRQSIVAQWSMLYFEQFTYLWSTWNEKRIWYCPNQFHKSERVFWTLSEYSDSIYSHAAQIMCIEQFQMLTNSL